VDLRYSGEGLNLRFCIVPLFCAGILAYSQCSFAGPLSANLPLDSWVYPALNKLSGLGLVDSSLQGMRPYTRREAARQVAEALQSSRREEISPAIGQLLDRLQEELHDQLVELGALEGVAPSSYFIPVREIDARYIYQDGQSSFYPGTNARQFALNDDNFGIDYADHHNGQLILTHEARLGGFLLLEGRPILEVRGDGVTSLKLLQGEVATGLGPVEVSFGRQSLWWGQGRHGSLILTDNAQPLDMLRITNPSPVLLPWIFKYLGPFRFDVFWSQLEDDRVVPHPYFAGLRLLIKPLPWIELGGSRTVIFGGEGRPSVDFSDFITILGGKNLSGDEDNSDQLAALDFRLRLPFLWGAEIYGEWGGEDEAGGFFSNMAYLGGIYLPKIESSERLSLRFEYADLSHIDENSPPWYHHDIYRSGYTYEGKILGHPVGGTGRDTFGELRALLPAGVTLSLVLDYQTRGSNQPVREKHLLPGLGLEWQMRPDMSLSAHYGLDEVKNFGYVPGDDRTFHLAELGLKITL
jgi:hypothetical protein